MVSKIIISSIFLIALISFSSAANIKRATDYGSGNNAAPIVDNAGEAPITKENAGKDDMSLRQLAEGAIAGAVQSGIANKLLGGNGNNDMPPQEQPMAQEDGGVDYPSPTHESKMKKVIKGAIQGAIAGGVAAAAGTAIQNNH